MSHYIKLLNLGLVTAPPSPPVKSIRDRFLAWHNGLPEFTRRRAFSMTEFEAALLTQGKYISPVLLDLGWRRKRLWSDTGRYHRYWEPPEAGDREGRR